MRFHRSTLWAFSALILWLFQPITCWAAPEYDHQTIRYIEACYKALAPYLEQPGDWMSVAGTERDAIIAASGRRGSPEKLGVYVYRDGKVTSVTYAKLAPEEVSPTDEKARAAFTETFVRTIDDFHSGANPTSTCRGVSG